MIDVLVIGAGPTGLTAAVEAKRHGLSVRIVDANDRRSIHSKALVLHSRSLEIFTDMGLVDKVLDSGQEFRALNIYADGKVISTINFHTIDWQDAIYPFWLSLPQSETERCLEEYLAEQGVKVERLSQLTDLSQADDGVTATISQRDAAGNHMAEQEIEAAWLVACDGAKSTTRKLSNIAFEGSAEDDVFILGDVLIDWQQADDEGYNFMAPEGILLVVPMPEPKRYRIIAHLPGLKDRQDPSVSLEMLQDLMNERTGMITKVENLAWSSSFTVKHLVAARHRQGRIFLAGDAAHIHSPVGGQGLNTGIQDAYNLMWKLALVQQGRGTDELLESYQVERHEVAESTIKNVSFATKLVTLKNPLTKGLRNQLASILINTDVVQNRFGRGVGMLDISYEASRVVQEHREQAKPLQRLRDTLSSKTPFDIGPASGQRCPNVAFVDEKGSSHSLIDYLYGTRHSLLLFADHVSPSPSRVLQEIQVHVAQRYANIIQCYLLTTAELAYTDWQGEVIVNTDRALHRRFGASEETLYLCRPDHHIGYCSQPVKADLFFDYLDRIFIPLSS